MVSPDGYAYTFLSWPFVSNSKHLNLFSVFSASQPQTFTSRDTFASCDRCSAWSVSGRTSFNICYLLLEKVSFIIISDFDIKPQQKTQNHVASVQNSCDAGKKCQRQPGGRMSSKTSWLWHFSDFGMQVLFLCWTTQWQIFPFCESKTCKVLDLNRCLWLRSKTESSAAKSRRLPELNENVSGCIVGKFPFEKYSWVPLS